jgi:hypothetical protein
MEIASDAASRAQEAYATFYNDFFSLGTRTSGEVQDLYASYVRTLQAASAGDDTVLRSAAEYGNAQREYARLSAEYARSAQQIYQAFLDQLAAIQSDADARALDRWIEHLQALKREAASAPASEDAPGADAPEGRRGRKGGGAGADAT